MEVEGGQTDTHTMKFQQISLTNLYRMNWPRLGADSLQTRQGRSVFKNFPVPTPS